MPFESCVSCGKCFVYDRKKKTYGRFTIGAVTTSQTAKCFFSLKDEPSMNDFLCSDCYGVLRRNQTIGEARRHNGERKSILSELQIEEINRRKAKGFLFNLSDTPGAADDADTDGSDADRPTNSGTNNVRKTKKAKHSEKPNGKANLKIRPKAKLKPPRDTKTTTGFGSDIVSMPGQHSPESVKSHFMQYHGHDRARGQDSFAKPDASLRSTDSRCQHLTHGEQAGALSDTRKSHNFSVTETFHPEATSTVKVAPDLHRHEDNGRPYFPETDPYCLSKISLAEICLPETDSEPGSPDNEIHYWHVGLAQDENAMNVSIFL